MNLMLRSSAIILACITTLISQYALTYDFSKKQESQAQRLIDAALKDEVGYDIVSSLTTEVGPRLAGSRAEARARAWAVKKFKSLDFKNIRVEEFDVPKWERGVETAFVISPFPQKLVITALGGSVATPDKGIEGDVIMFPSLAALKNIKNNSLKGKIVYIDESMARTQDGSGYSAAVKKRGATAFEAYRVGASAALIRSVGTSNHRFAHTGQMKSIIDKAAPSVPAAALSVPDANQLSRMLKASKKVRIRVTLTPKLVPAGRSGNVIAEIPGSKNPEEIVLIGAHLDSWDLGTGAIDDGAGVGIVMAAAHLVKQTIKQAPKRTIRVVLFGAEEVGLVGAESYTKKYKDELNQHVIAAESDFGAGAIWKFSTANVAENKLGAIRSIEKILRPLLINRGNNKAYGGPDLKFLREAGVPIADLVQDGSDYFDLHHTADDTLNKIDKNKLRQNIAAYAAFSYLAASVEKGFK